MPKNIFMGFIVPLSILLPIIVFLFKYKLAGKGLKYLFYFLILAALINLAALFLVRMGMRNLPLLHLYTVVETVFFLAYFHSIFENENIKKVIKVIMFAFPALCVVNFIFIQDLFTFNTYTRPLEALIITVICLLYLYKSSASENWLGSPINWVNMGILLYFPAASIIFILANYFTFVGGDGEMSRSIWNLHAILVLAMYLIWTKAFSLIKK
ncbi:hypothetical protein [Pedobacter xixiisoli]|uniref:Histidine kinase N-terminal 7TM region domain-containing protein n=1 Tax=Pedobacter xixiisoli TaxID=1476464 RepID=A0A285ZRC3_9SPHI|nr:hypothetical protein [Pedobacter xixiisoli]SOD12178.1 hypothetical protein SAMN06297358_0533 [Pedobacter xixiisoli]